MTASGEPRVPRWLLALLSGALLAVSFPGSGDQGWAAFAALVPLLAAVEGADWRRAGLLGFGAGLVFWIATIPWIAQTIVRYGALPWPPAVLVLLGLAGYLALYTAAFCAVLSRVSVSRGAPFVLAAGTLWVALEFLRTYLLTGFPWNLLGYSQYRNVPLIQVAAVTGVYGVSFVVVTVNAALWRLLARDGGWKEPLAAAAAAAGALAVAMASAWLPPRAAGEATLSVALAQGSIDQGVKWDPTSRDATLAVYRTLTVDAARRGAQLIVWPETSVPLVFEEGLRRADVQALARETRAYLLVGALGRAPEGLRNSAFLVAPDGEVVGRYDKRHLVPFGEYVPFQRLLPFVEVLSGGATGELRSGREATIFPTAFGRLGVVICYEAIFPAEVRDFFLGGADVLVNITNDAWFGRSAAPVQHLAMAAFRAVEHRAYLVRAANTGISAIVTPDGRILQASALFTRGIVAGAIAPRAGLSVYTRYGDVFAWATVVVALAAMWPVTRTRRVEMQGNQETGFVLGGEAGRLDGRRGLVASLVAGTAALAAAWGWRWRSAGGRGYQEIARWGIPGGQGRFIAVDVEPTAEALRALGERLRQEFDGLDNAVVMVFDNPAAARAIRQGSRVVGEERFQAALAHQRAMYTKQTARGEHALMIYTQYPEVGEVVRYDGARPPAARGTRPPLHAGMKILVPIVALSVLATACAKRPATTAVTAPAPTGQATTTPQARAAEPAAPSTPTSAAPGTGVTPGGPGAPRDGATVTTPGAPTTRPSPREFTAIPELKDIHFDFDKYDIRPGDARILDDNARWMKANPGYLVLVEGHADERGTNEYNLALGERRAKAARNYLVAQGVQAARLTIISYGEERPVCREKTEVCWARNRRAHFLAKPR